MLIDCLKEWEAIYAGKVSADEITARRHALMIARHDADRRLLPTPLPIKPALLKLAEAEATTYFEVLFRTEVPK